jgi:hypothetical protein
MSGAGRSMVRVARTGLANDAAMRGDEGEVRLAALADRLRQWGGTHLIPACIDHGVVGLARHPTHHQRHLGRVEEHGLASLRPNATKQSRFPLWLRIASCRPRWRLPISPSRLHRALHARVKRIERGRAANVESVSLLTAEAQIGDGFRDVDLAEQIAVLRVAAHAVLVRITPTH